MSTRGASLLAVAAVLALFALFVFLLVRFPGPVGWLFAVLKVVYDRWEFAYLLVNRGYFWLVNQEMRWNFSVEVRVKDGRELLAQIPALIVQHFPDRNAKVETLSRTRLRVVTDGKIFEAHIDEDGSVEESLLRLDVHRLPTTFRTAEALLDEQLVPLLHDIEARSGSGKSTYHLAIDFNGTNPFYGLFVRRLRSSAVDTFKVVLRGERETVHINQETVTVQSESVATLRKVAANYLALGSGEIPLVGS